MFRTNVASQAAFAQMNSREDGSPLTADVTVKVVTGAAGTYEDSAGTLTHMGGGLWRYVPSQGETNAPVLAVQFNHATGVNVGLTLLTTAANPASATRGLAGTALPDAAAGASGGLPISDAGGLDLDTLLGRLDAAVTTRQPTIWSSASATVSLSDTTVAAVTSVGSVAGNVGGNVGGNVVGSVGGNVTGTIGGFTTAAKAELQTEADDALAARGVTSTRMGYVDNLNVGGNVASSAEVTAVQNNTRVVRVVPTVIERPDSGTTTYRIELLLYDTAGNMEAPDSAPTLALVDQGGTDLSSRLDSATGSLVSTGRYRWVYTASDSDELEQLVWTFSVIEGGATRLYGNTSLIVDTTAADFTSADRTKLEAIHAKLPSKTYLTGTTNSDGDVQMDEATGNFSGSVGSISGITFPSNFGSLGINASGHVSRVTLVDTTTTNTDMRGTDNALLAVNYTAPLSAAQTQTECEEALQAYHLDHLIASADPGGVVANSSFLAKLVSASVTPAFSDYVNTTDSLQALRDRGDVAWLTATGFSTHSATDVWAAGTRTLTAATNITSTGGTITVSSGKVTVGTNDDKSGYTISGTITTLDALDTAQDTQHATTQGLVTTVDGVVDAILADTNELQTDWANGGRLDLLLDAAVATMTTQMTESYNADGVAPTPVQALFVIMQRLTEFAISGTTITVKQLDGSTTAYTLTLDSSTTPTSSTRAT